MTRLFFTILATGFSLQIIAQDCPNDIDIPFSQLPTKAKTFLSQYDATFMNDCEMFNTPEGKRYNVEFDKEEPSFENEMIFVFDQEGELLSSGYEIEVTDQTMPSKMVTYMNSNYPDNIIREIEMHPLWKGEMVYELKYEGSRDRMYFTMDGKMLCIEVRDK